jgi:hypothetical protein
MFRKQGHSPDKDAEMGLNRESFYYKTKEPEGGLWVIVIGP